MHFYNQSIVTSKITFSEAANFDEQNVHLENIVLQVHFFYDQIFIIHRHDVTKLSSHHA